MAALGTLVFGPMSGPDNSNSLGNRLSRWFESTILWLVQALLVVIIVMSLAYLWILLWRAFADGRFLAVDTVAELQTALQRGLAGVLLVVLALEVREALRHYFVEHHVKLETILTIALIAIGRHIIQLDYEHTSAAMMAGMAALIAALVGGLFIIRRSLADPPGKRNG